MGQLERYGLYVLCVVIVLILGVAIWGGDSASASKGSPVHNLELNTNDGGLDALGSSGSAGNGTGAQVPADPTEGFFDPVQIEDAQLNGLMAAAMQVESGTGTVPVSSKAPVVPGGPVTTEKTEGPEKIEKADDVDKPVSAPPALRTYIVKKGDTMGDIARKQLGSTRFAKNIAELNPRVKPRKMREGTVLKLPWIEGAAKPDANAGTNIWREHVVQKNDNVYDISLRYYKTARHYKKILETNGITNPKKLMPGTKLKIPPVK